MFTLRLTCYISVCVALPPSTLLSRLHCAITCVPCITQLNAVLLSHMTWALKHQEILGAQKASAMLTAKPVCRTQASMSATRKQTGAPGCNARGTYRSTHESVDSEEDVTGNMTDVDTMHVRKAAADVQPKAPSQPVISGMERPSKQGRIHYSCSSPKARRLIPESSCSHAVTASRCYLWICCIAGHLDVTGS